MGGAQTHLAVSTREANMGRQRPSSEHPTDLLAYLSLTILVTLLDGSSSATPQTAIRPFFKVTISGSLIATTFLNFTEYAVSSTIPSSAFLSIPPVLGELANLRAS